MYSDDCLFVSSLSVSMSFSVPLLFAVTLDRVLVASMRSVDRSSSNAGKTTVRYKDVHSFIIACHASTSDRGEDWMRCRAERYRSDVVESLWWEKGEGVIMLDRRRLLVEVAVVALEEVEVV